MQTLLQDYAGRAEFEALCAKAQESYKRTSENVQLERVMREMYSLLYCLDDLSNRATDNRASQYANAGQMVQNTLEYMLGILNNLQN